MRLIDFTASRLQTPGGDVVFCDLEGEDGLFDGPKGKPQFETYRCVDMRQQSCVPYRAACTHKPERHTRPHGRLSGIDSRNEADDSYDETVG